MTGNRIPPQKTSENIYGVLALSVPRKHTPRHTANRLFASIASLQVALEFLLDVQSAVLGLPPHFLELKVFNPFDMIIEARNSFGSRIFGELIITTCWTIWKLRNSIIFYSGRFFNFGNIISQRICPGYHQGQA